jgi:hypothetical protein
MTKRVVTLKEGGKKSDDSINGSMKAVEDEFPLDSSIKKEEADNGFNTV